MKPRNGIAVGRLKSSGGPKKADNNLTCSNVAPGSPSKSGDMQANGYLCIAPDVKLGQNVKLSKFINLYGCEVGDDTKIGAFVEIQKNAKVGKRCKISSHTFICEGVTIEDEVLIGHNVTFVNDSFPRATSATGALQTEADWKVESHPGEKRRVNRIGSDHPIERGDRRKCVDRRRQRRDKRCARERDRGRKSGESVAVP